METGPFSLPLPLLWILYFGYVTRTFAGHASNFMFAVYLVVGFVLGYGPVTSNGLRYSKTDVIHMIAFVLWTSILFLIIRTPGNFWGLIS